MPKAIWRGNISFGLIVMPVKLYSAAEPKLISFHLLCKKHMRRLKYNRYCEAGQHNVSWEDVVHGYEYARNKWVTFSKDELQQLPIPESKNIEIAEFVDISEIDPLFYDKSYFIAPEKGAEKAFALLKEALQLENKAAVGKVVLRNKDYLVVVRGYKNMMLLSTLYYEDELRKPSMFTGLAQQKVSKDELKLASNLIAKQTRHFSISEFKNNYKQVLQSFIEAKLSGRKLAVPEAKPTKDLMKALEASLVQAKKPKRKKK